MRSSRLSRTCHVVGMAKNDMCGKMTHGRQFFINTRCYYLLGCSQRNGGRVGNVIQVKVTSPSEMRIVFSLILHNVREYGSDVPYIRGWQKNIYIKYKKYVR